MTTQINQTFESLVEEFMSLGETSKAQVLLSLACQLTLVARGFNDTEDSIVELKASNERIHRVLGVLTSMTLGREDLDWQRCVLEGLLYGSAGTGSGNEILFVVRRALTPSTN